jgi:hypothetical protein
MKLCPVLVLTILPNLLIIDLLPPIAYFQCIVFLALHQSCLECSEFLLLTINRTFHKDFPINLVLNQLTRQLVYINYALVCVDYFRHLQKSQSQHPRISS